MSDNFRRPPLSHASGAPETDNLNIQTAGPPLTSPAHQGNGGLEKRT
jgi:hypothetical protein